MTAQIPYLNYPRFLNVRPVLDVDALCALVLLAAGAAFLVVADFIVFMTVLLAAGAFVFAPVALEAAAAPAPVVFFTTVPVLVSLDSLTFRLPRVAVAVAGLLLPAAGFLPAAAAAAGAAAFLARAGAVEPELELAEEAVVTFLVSAAPPAPPPPRAPLAFSTMFDSRFDDDAFVPGPPLTGDAGRENVLGFAGEDGGGRSRAGMMRAFDEVGDRICPWWC